MILFILLMTMAATIILFGVSIVRTVQFGGKITGTRDVAPAMKKHKRSAYVTYVLMWLAILVTEFTVRFKGGGTYGPLFWVHMSGVVPFFVIFNIMLFWMTGVKNARVHRTLGYLLLAFLALVIITGVLMFLRLF